MANPGAYGIPTSGNVLGGTGTAGMAYDSASFNHLGKTDFNYIPTLYAGQLLVKFYESSVLSVIANTDYEGEIKQQGDSIIIRALPNIDVKEHKKGQVLDHEYPAVSSQTLNIDKGRYYAFVTDDIDAAQTDIKDFISKFTSEASYHMRNEIEKDVLTNITNSVGLKGTVRGINLGTPMTSSSDADPDPIGLKSTNIVTKILEMGQLLDENNIPEDGRFLLLPPQLITKLKSSELRQANLTGDAVTPLRNGQVGMIDRFTIYSTNNVRRDVGAADTYGNAVVTSGLEDDQGTAGTGDDVAVASAGQGGGFFNCIFGHKAGLTFASQMVKSESMINPDGFGQLHRGLQVYGYKVVKSDAIGNLYAYADTES